MSLTRTSVKLGWSAAARASSWPEASMVTETPAPSPKPSVSRRENRDMDRPSRTGLLGGFADPHWLDHQRQPLLGLADIVARQRHGVDRFRDLDLEDHMPAPPERRFGGGE